jgi:adenosylcobinamide kinase/adenosylcobinamide-phosphate guanylyltransferase
MSLTLILGGARSGKSTYAQETARRLGGQVLYVATAQASDEEMSARIAAHRAERPAGWTTLEAPVNVGEAIRDAARSAGGPGPDVILLDCVTLLANNALLALPEPLTTEAAEAALLSEVESLLSVAAASGAAWFIVSNEVGLGLVPPYPLGRVYRDALGRANQRLAAAADTVLLMVAGLPMVVKGKL